MRSKKPPEREKQKAKTTATSQTLCTQRDREKAEGGKGAIFANLEQDEVENEKPAGEKQATRNCRNRKAPDRYGLPVHICGVEKETKAQK